MIALQATILYFLTYALIKFFYVLLSRRVQLRVSLIADTKYLSKQWKMPLRSYLLLQDGIRKRTLSFLILSSQLIIFYYLYKSQLYGDPLNYMAVGLSFLVVLLSALLLPTNKNKIMIKLYDNHFLILVVFYILMIFIPNISNMLGSLSHIIYAGSLLLIGLAIVYFSIDYFNYSLNVKHKNTFMAMQACLVIIYFVNETLKYLAGGIGKTFLVMFVSIVLTTTMLVVFRLSTSKTKEESLAKQSCALLVLMSIMLIMLGGGLTI